MVQFKIYVNNGSGNGMALVQCQGITWTTDELIVWGINTSPVAPFTNMV